MSLLCRLGMHTTFPRVVGRWYVNGRCTRCGSDLRGPRARHIEAKS